MSTTVRKIDFKKDYGTVRIIGENPLGIKYTQANSYFNHHGRFVKLINPEVPSGAPSKGKAAVVPPPKKSEEQIKREALAAAANKLGLDTVPQSLKDAAKENAEALAAEENA